MMFLLAPILYLAFAVFYEWLFIGLDGATPGKAAVQIKVVDEISGGTIGLGRAFVRHLIILGPLLLPYLGLVVCFVVLLSPLFDSSGRSQGWHDKIAKDLVVKR